MANQAELSEFLDVRMDEIKEPGVLPTGLYKFVITRYGIDRATNDKRTPFVRATLKPVDIVECEEEVDVNNVRTLTYDFWRTEAADRIAADFFKRKLKLDVPAGSTIGDMWESAIGCEVIGEVEQSTSAKGNVFAKVLRFSAPEE